jgi:glycosyltransferase involved in cell wall biosynthesis
MRIAQVPPLYESVPPQLYGGTERVVSFLTEELVRQGHEVTLFASSDSNTQAELISPCARALRLDTNCRDPLTHHIVMLEQVARHASRFEIIHFHCDYLHFPISRRERWKHVTTLHGRLDGPDLESIYREYPNFPLVSISNAQRQPLPWVNWQGNVYHGLPKNLFSFHERPGKYLAFLGRISAEKGIAEAIGIAQNAGMELKVAAKVDPADSQYYREVIKPLLDEARPLVEFIDEIGEKEKDDFLGNAYALLFPIDWPEPFGLVMIEAMACGTPIIAYPRGSVPEVMEDGVTGFVVEGMDQAVEAVERVGRLDRRECRQVFEERFTAPRMARDYVRIYRRLLEKEAVLADGKHARGIDHASPRVKFRPGLLRVQPR